MPNIERPLSGKLAHFVYFHLSQFLNPHGRRRNDKPTRELNPRERADEKYQRCGSTVFQLILE